MKAYDHKDIETKWQKEWETNGTYTVSDTVAGKDNFYELVEFTYPSGNLHVGHWYAYAVPDIHARYKRMQGLNVLYPIGFDAFGLPAENAAIKLGADPKIWTYEQMDTMRVQLRSMGAMFDWNREVVSCSPEYYKWTQWMFNQFLKHDLVYRAVTQVNWCPKDQTILANEQVVDGKCERCGTEVVQREQPQWMLRITKYADRLIDDLDTLEWPHAIKESQKNWIGRSEGSEIIFKLSTGDDVKVFTTRADTLFGVTYVVLAPEHSLVQKIISNLGNKDEILSYIDATKKKLELERQQSKDKTGVQLKGVTAINPVNGEEVPVWIADYVLAGYGTGAVMAVPQHDDRDREFAATYNLPVVDRELVDKEEITKKVGGKLVSTYRLRDWGISRQRYWGTPIPIVYDPEGKAHPVPDEHLPWILPTDVDHTPDGTSPLARSTELLERTESIFGKGWKPEVETMDTFVDSTWYFYRYLDNKNDSAFAAPEKMNAWMPIDLYMGGAEHTTMHVLYSRFWTKALKDIGLVNDTEAFTVRRNRGLILGPDGNKMSKSKGNVINPDEIVERLGADTVRMYLAFMGPYGVTTNYPWDPNGVVGVRRFLERVWKLKEKIGDSKVTPQLHKAIKKMTDDIDEFKFNTAISAMMILINEWEKFDRILELEYKTLLRLLAPFAPHMTEELWHELGETSSVHLSEWPKVDPALLVDDVVTIGVQINGKVRDELTIAVSATKEDIQTAALALSRIKEYIEGKSIKTVIVVPGRIINIVVI
ncbi:MAG: leucine--tRNA ligase [Candidatus Pacebacteria bacterium]|jgi:leucyl-tRNA synthetase|nr:leucine--tRNA ligase [Candidatus Paceibacterota bacterium]